MTGHVTAPSLSIQSIRSHLSHRSWFFLLLFLCPLLYLVRLTSLSVWALVYCPYQFLLSSTVATSLLPTSVVLTKWCMYVRLFPVHLTVYVLDSPVHSHRCRLATSAARWLLRPTPLPSMSARALSVLELHAVGEYFCSTLRCFRCPLSSVSTLVL